VVRGLSGTVTNLVDAQPTRVLGRGGGQICARRVQPAAVPGKAAIMQQRQVRVI